ncbi:MAG: RDD family protein [Myxococcales bacterium]|nr:RDD family protein [Myxococcales bacterium]
MSARAPGRRRAPAGERLDTIARVESPELVRFQYRLAGPSRRVLAYLFDLLIKAGVILVLGGLLLLGGVNLKASAGWTIGLLLTVAFVAEWGYGVLFESLMRGQTPGKRVMRLRVVKEGGQPINFMDALLRNLLRGADFLPGGYALGAAVMSVDPRFRRLGDLVAGTMVVVEERSHVGAPVRLRPPPTPEELASVPAAARLGSEEREALDLFVRRLDRLGAARADELAALLLPRFAGALPADAEARPARALTLLYLRATGRSADVAGARPQGATP